MDPASLRRRLERPAFERTLAVRFEGYTAGARALLLRTDAGDLHRLRLPGLRLELRRGARVELGFAGGIPAGISWQGPALSGVRFGDRELAVGAAGGFAALGSGGLAVPPEGVFNDSVRWDSPSEPYYVLTCTLDGATWWLALRRPVPRAPTSDGPRGVQ